MRLSDRIQIDDRLDVATIDGRMVSGEVFSAFTKKSEPGEWFRIVESEPGGVIIIERKREPARIMEMVEIFNIRTDVRIGDLVRSEKAAGWLTPNEAREEQK